MACAEADQDSVQCSSSTTTEDYSDDSLTHTKEKTPLCLLNELIRYNKVKHKYTLIDEQGPAHQKTFYIKLTLGSDEEYSAQGQSIKKAQHQAALLALNQTRLQQPQPKQDAKAMHINSTITPTVMLNSLAMRCGSPVVYDQPEVSKSPIHPGMNNAPGYRKDDGGRSSYGKRHFYVTVHVGDRKYLGNGTTRQEARHSAALKALASLKDTLMVKQKKKAKKAEMENATEEENQQVLKSEISVVHEIALKKEVEVDFEMIRESGPPHMKTFVTRCTVGDLVAEGHGSGKKLSKKDAALKMLDLLRQEDGQLPVTVSCYKKTNNKNTKNRRKQAIKIQRADPNYGANINPISRLIQIQDAQKAAEPTYTLIAEKGNPPHREFIMQIEMDGHVCTGVGPNKKLAKRSAAESMLAMLGLNNSSPPPSKSSIKQPEAMSDKKVTFIDQNGQHDSVVLQPVNPYSQFIGGNNMPPVSVHMTPQAVAQPTAVQSPEAAAVIAKELLENGVSPTAQTMHPPVQSPSTQPAQGHAVKQLQYLAQVLNIHVQFDDFPKQDSNEFLSLVTLSTTPPHVSHGTGLTKEEANNNAALLALNALSTMGVDRVTSQDTNGSQQ